MGCKHKNKLVVYGRDKNNWISSLKIRGHQVFICQDCGDIFQEELKKIEVKK